MNDLDPAQADSFEDLATCLRQIHIRAGKPSYRLLEQQTTREEGGQLPGSRFKRVRLGRGNITDVLAGRKFPSKAFLLTFVDACEVELETDRRWEQAWDRLALGQVTRAEERLNAEAIQLRQQLAEAEERIRELSEEKTAAETQARDAEAQADQAAMEIAQLRQQVVAAEESGERLKAAEVRANRADWEVGQLRGRLEEIVAEAEELRQQLTETEARLREELAAAREETYGLRRQLEDAEKRTRQPVAEAEERARHAAAEAGHLRQLLTEAEKRIAQQHAAALPDIAKLAAQMGQLDTAAATRAIQRLNPHTAEAVREALETQKNQAAGNSTSAIGKHRGSPRLIRRIPTDEPDASAEYWDRLGSSEARPGIQEDGSE